MSEVNAPLAEILEISPEQITVEQAGVLLESWPSLSTEERLKYLAVVTDLLSAGTPSEPDPTPPDGTPATE